MDVGPLIRAARERARINQAELARRVGTDRAQISRYETGTVSPTVTTLNRLLAACDLQLRGTLEPRLAHVDERLDRLLAGEVTLATADLANLALTLEDDPAGKVSLWNRPSRGPRGACRWAFDGDTALQLQGLAVADRAICLALVLDESARAWLCALGAGLDVRGFRICIEDARDELLLEGLAQPFLTTLSLILQVRVVTELPATVQLAVPWADRPLPVVTVDAVEQGHPQHAELLGRWRERRRQRAE